MSDPLWNEYDDLTDGWDERSWVTQTWTAAGDLTDSWVQTETAFDKGIFGDDDFYIIGDDGEYISQD